MRILDKYIVKNIFSGYLFILLVFVGLYFIVDVFSNLSDILAAKVPINIVAQYYLWSIPLIFARISPFALLISVLFNVGELNKNNEIINMRASGISVIRIAFPIVVLACLLSLLALLIQEKIIIYAQKNVDEIKSVYIKKESSNLNEEKNIAFPSNNMIVFARKFSPRTNTMEDAAMFIGDSLGNITRKAICATLTYENDLWIGRNVIEYDLNESGNIIDKPIHWDSKKIELDRTPRELISRQGFSQSLSMKELSREIKRLRQIKAVNVANNFMIDYHQKIADPFSHLFLVLAVLPMAMEIRKRKVALASLGIGFLVGFAFYMLTSFCLALGKAGVILPLLSAWVTPLFFLTVGITGLLLSK